MLELRLLTESDIPLIEAWLKKPHVCQWYEIPHLNITIDDWIAEIKAYNGAFSWITYCIALNDDTP